MTMLTSPYRFGGSALTSRRYLRIRITANQGAGGASTYAISQLTCHETAGGADVLAGSGATITATSTFTGGGSWGTGNLTDGNDSTVWASNSGGTQDLIIDWGAGAGKNICEIGVKGRNDSSAGQTPFTMSVDYSADDVTYTTDWSIPDFFVEQFASGTTFPLQKIRRPSLYPSTGSSHRIWGIRWNASPASFAELAQLELRASVSGSTICTGGKAVCGGFFSNSFPPDLAFNGTSSQWAAVSIAHSFLGYDFLEGNEKSKPAEIMIKASSIPSRAPTDFDLWYQDGVGGAVTIQQNFTTAAFTTGGQVKTFTVP